MKKMMIAKVATPKNTARIKKSRYSIVHGRNAVYDRFCRWCICRH